VAYTAREGQEGGAEGELEAEVATIVGGDL